MKNKQQRKKRRRILLSIFAAFAFAFNPMNKITYTTAAPEKTYTQQETQRQIRMAAENTPIASYWFPQDLLNWSSATDADVEFNKSVVPLAQRVEKDKLELSNENQHKETEVVAISIMNANTSGNPTHGSNKFSANTFSYWQYIDKLVYWGGSAGEGIIIPPSPDVTDSAHKNGVPVLGTVFFPQSEHGGKLEWLNEFLVKDANGNFPMADKLIEVCRTYGFDGWFINQETQGTTAEHSKLMQEFIKYFKAQSNNELEIMWYDSMIDDGGMKWQNALTDKNKMFLIDDNGSKVADSMFLNFWWTNQSQVANDLLYNSKLKADELGLNPFSLFAGIDVQSNGYNTPIRWELFDREGLPFTSLGLYCPSWTYFSSNNVDEFQAKENRFWVNEHGDPTQLTNTTDREWRGISNYAVEKSAVTQTPFVTNFSMGNGEGFYVNGEKVSSNPWNNRSMNDIMPTYRWVIDNEEGSKLNADIDYSTAYYGGNSISLQGNLAAGKSSTIKLYSADLKVENKAEFKVTAKSSAENVNLDLALEFHGDKEPVVISSQSKEALGTDWTTLTYDVSKYKNKNIKSISLKVSSDSNIDNANVNLGNISIMKSQTKADIKITKASVEDVAFGDDIYAGIRLTWNANDSVDKNLNHYEVYKVNEDGTKTFLGATPSTNFYVDGLKRNSSSETETTLEVVPVAKDLTKGNGKSVNFGWPAYPAPKASFNVSKTFVAPGEEVTFSNTSSEVTEEIEWVFEGANVETSTEENPTVTFDKEGVYSVTLKAKNSSGESVEIKEGIITVSESAKEVKNLSLEETTTATASSFVNNGEAPQYAIDGVQNTKWCAVGNGPHSITIDLGDVKTISEIGIGHAEFGGEGAGMNTSAYRVEVSNDNENWTEVINVTGNTKGKTNDAIKVADGRYVRLTLDKATQGADSAARIYEVEVYGLDK